MSPASQAAIEQRHTRLNPGFKPTAADALLKQHPTPHKLKPCLSLAAKH